jgi:hypothetical protein
MKRCEREMKQDTYGYWTLGFLPLLLLVAGCYAPDLDGEGYFRCSDGACPNGFVCNAQQRCVRSGEPIIGCQAEPEERETVLLTELSTSIGLALDPVTRQLYVSGADATRVVVIAGEADGEEWSPEVYSRRQVESGQVGYTAIDAYDGRHAVVFDGGRFDTPADDELVGRSVFISTEPQTIGTKLDVDYGAGSGAFLAIRQVPEQPHMLVAYRSDNRTQVALVEYPSGRVLRGPVAIEVSGSAPQRAGQFNRLAVTGSSPELLTAQVAFVATSGAADLESTRAFVADLELGAKLPTPMPDVMRQAIPVGDLSVDVPEASRGVDFAFDDETRHLVWVEKPGNATQIKYRGPGVEEAIVEPGGNQPRSAGAPAIAAAEGRVGLSYIDAEGVLWITARSSENQSWLAALPIEDTRDAAARQAKLEIIALADSTMVLALAYATTARELRFRRIVCTLP